MDVIAGPGSLWVQEAKRQVSHVVGIDGFAGPSDLTVIASDGADVEALNLDLPAQAEHGEGSLTVAVSDAQAILDGLTATAQVLVDDMEAALAFAEALAPEHLQLAGADGRGVGAARALRGLPVRGQHLRHRVRRLRRRVRTTRSRPRAPRVSPPASTSPLPAPDGGGPRGRGGAPLAPRRVPIADAEGFPAHAASMGQGRERCARFAVSRRRRESSPVTRTASIDRKTGETDVSLTLGLSGTGAGARATGVGFFDHMLDLLARHGRLDLDVDVTGDLRPARTTPSRTRGSCSARRSTTRSATAAGSSATATRSCRWTRRARCARWTSPGRPFVLLTGFERLPAGAINGFDHDLAEEFFRAVACAARLTLHLDLQAGTNAHHMIEACFKAFARALRAAVSIDPEETGVPSTKGTLT